MSKVNFGLSSDRTYNLMDLGNKTRLSTRLGQPDGPMIPNQSNNKLISKMTDSKDFSSDIELVEHLKSHFGLTDDRTYDIISSDDKTLIGMRLATILWQLSNGDLDNMMQGILSR